MNSWACAGDNPRSINFGHELVDERLGGRDATGLEGVDDPGLELVLQTADHLGEPGVEALRRLRSGRAPPTSRRRRVRRRTSWMSVATRSTSPRTCASSTCRSTAMPPTSSASVRAPAMLAMSSVSMSAIVSSRSAIASDEILEAAASAACSSDGDDLARIFAGRLGELQDGVGHRRSRRSVLGILVSFPRAREQSTGPADRSTPC